MKKLVCAKFRKGDVFLRSRQIAILAATILAGCASMTVQHDDSTRPLSENDPAYKAFYAAAAKLTRSANTRPTRDNQAFETVARVFNNLVAASQISEHAELAEQFTWELAVYDKPGYANALALPGGRVLVFTDLLASFEDENELAAIIGHEFAHSLNQHAKAKYDQIVAGQMLGDVGYIYEGADGRAKIKAALTLFLALPYSRSAEIEADVDGMRLAALAGYDPAAAPRYWLRMAAMRRETDVLTSTHPSSQQRAESLQKSLPAAKALRAERANQISSVVYQYAGPLKVHQVKELQAGLNYLGFNSGPPDGIFGARTASAIEEFQALWRLSGPSKPSGLLLSQVRAAAGKPFSETLANPVVTNNAAITSPIPEFYAEYELPPSLTESYDTGKSQVKDIKDSWRELKDLLE